MRADFRIITGSVLVLAFTATACTATVAPISGTPTAEKVLSNARRVARKLDSYRATMTVTENTYFPGNPELDFSESTVSFVEMERENKFRITTQSEFAFIRSDDLFYIQQDSEEWTVHQAKIEDDGFPPGELSPLPATHPELWLDIHRLGRVQFGGMEYLESRPVYLIEGFVPPPPQNGSARIALTDRARIYVDTVTFETVRIEVDREIRDGEREDVGYQVIPGIVEKHTLEIYEYSGHNSDIEITLPGVQPGV